LHALELEPGDLVYMPRGQIHGAWTETHSSLHLTIGVHCFRFVDLITTAVAQAAEDCLSLRRCLPCDAFEGGKELTRERFLQIAGEINWGLWFDKALETVQATLS